MPGWPRAPQTTCHVCTCAPSPASSIMDTEMLSPAPSRKAPLLPQPLPLPAALWQLQDPLLHRTTWVLWVTCFPALWAAQHCPASFCPVGLGQASEAGRRRRKNSGGWVGALQPHVNPLCAAGGSHAASWIALTWRIAANRKEIPLVKVKEELVEKGVFSKKWRGQWSILCHKEGGNCSVCFGVFSNPPPTCPDFPGTLRFLALIDLGEWRWLVGLVWSQAGREGSVAIQRLTDTEANKMVSCLTRRMSHWENCWAIFKWQLFRSLSKAPTV